MSDFVWFIIIGIVLMGTGLVFAWLGLAIWKKQKIHLMIRYHMDKVSDENKQAYCRLCGIGLTVTGAGFILSGICMIFLRTPLTLIPMAAGLVSGTVLLITAIARYNH